jgi:hypothetical protein
MLLVHLNPYRFVPLVCCDQLYTVDERQITGVHLWYKNFPTYEIDPKISPVYKMRFFDWRDHWWPWSSTSSMMFRKDALHLMRPPSELPTKLQADAYLAPGSRYLGGSIVFDKPLVLRGVHQKNVYLDDRIISSSQIQKKDLFVDYMPQFAELVLVNILRNGGRSKFEKNHFRKIIKKEYSVPAIRRMIMQTEEVRKILSRRDVISSLLRHLRRFGRKKSKLI